MKIHHKRLGNGSPTSKKGSQVVVGSLELPFHQLNSLFCTQVWSPFYVTNSIESCVLSKRVQQLVALLPAGTARCFSNRPSVSPLELRAALLMVPLPNFWRSRSRASSRSFAWMKGRQVPNQEGSEGENGVSYRPRDSMGLEDKCPQKGTPWEK